MTDTKLLVEVLRTAAEQRQRVATKAATELLAEGAPKDVRAGAVRIARLLAEAGELVEVADQLEAGLLVVIAIDADALDEDPPEPAGEPERTLRVVPPPPTEETEPVTPPAPKTPTEAAVDAATADAEAILAEAFPGDDDELGTVLPEEGRAPQPRTPAVSAALGKPIETVGDARAALAAGAEPAAVAAELLAPDPDDDLVLPPGQGDDDDLSVLADVTELDAFDAERTDLDGPARP